ncbi:MAG: RNA pyrophosphohydrolase [Pseudomonadota bacterium]
MQDDLPYRPCVGVVLANANGLIFTGERIDTPGAWQMPQGGIDDGEAPEAAALRELEEETGLPANLVTIEAEHPAWVTYELPPHLIGKLWKGRFRGQKQKWFLFRFKGPDTAIDIARHDHEFARWRWSDADQVLRDIVPFKRAVYEQVVEHFRAQL